MSAIQDGAVSVLGLAAAAAILFSPPDAHADPYAGPHCSPYARDYDSRMCAELPQNNSACTPYGDRDQCVGDWLDYQRQQHNYYTPTPN